MSVFQETAVPLSRDNLVINELIREYLLFNGYRNTLSVLLPGADLAFSNCLCSTASCLFIAAEARQPQTAPFDRTMLASMLGVNQDNNTDKV